MSDEKIIKMIEKVINMEEFTEEEKKYVELKIDRECKKCKKEKKLCEFYRVKKGRSGFDSVCKVCKKKDITKHIKAKNEKKKAEEKKKTKRKKEESDSSDSDSD
jgi:formate dehydrogenase assembly factor FdhD